MVTANFKHKQNLFSSPRICRHCHANVSHRLLQYPHLSATGRIRFRRVRLQTPSSVSFLALIFGLLFARVCVCQCKLTRLSQNSPNLVENSVISLFRNSTLETVFRPMHLVRVRPIEVRLQLLDLRSRPPFTGVLRGSGPESAPRSAF